MATVRAQETGMELKKPGLAGGPDIKREPSHPKPGSRLWREQLPQCLLLQRKEGYWGTGDMLASPSAPCSSTQHSHAGRGWEGPLSSPCPL